MIGNVMRNDGENDGKAMGKCLEKGCNCSTKRRGGAFRSASRKASFLGLFGHTGNKQKAELIMS